MKGGILNLMIVYMGAQDYGRSDLLDKVSNILRLTIDPCYISLYLHWPSSTLNRALPSVDLGFLKGCRPRISQGATTVRLVPSIKN